MHGRFKGFIRLYPSLLSLRTSYGHGKALHERLHRSWVSKSQRRRHPTISCKRGPFFAMGRIGHLWCTVSKGSSPLSLCLCTAAWDAHDATDKHETALRCMDRTVSATSYSQQERIGLPSTRVGLCLGGPTCRPSSSFGADMSFSPCALMTDCIHDKRKNMTYDRNDASSPW